MTAKEVDSNPYRAPAEVQTMAPSVGGIDLSRMLRLLAASASVFLVPLATLGLGDLARGGGCSEPVAAVLSVSGLAWPMLLLLRAAMFKILSRGDDVLTEPPAAS